MIEKTIQGISPSIEQSNKSVRIQEEYSEGFVGGCIGGTPGLLVIPDWRAAGAEWDRNPVLLRCGNQSLCPPQRQQHVQGHNCECLPNPELCQ